MHESTHLKFAVFPNPARALAARKVVDEAIDGDGEVELLTEEGDLAPDKIPLQLTMARLGTIFGASLVASAGLVALGTLIMLEVPGVPKHIPSPWATAGVVGLLAAILGGLAGALSFSTRIHAQLDRLRNLLHFGNTVLLVESERDVGEMLRRRGAIQVGTLV